MFNLVYFLFVSIVFCGVVIRLSVESKDRVSRIFFSLSMLLFGIHMGKLHLDNPMPLVELLNRVLNNIVFLLVGIVLTIIGGVVEKHRVEQKK